MLFRSCYFLYGIFIASYWLFKAMMAVKKSTLQEQILLQVCWFSALALLSRDINKFK
jgi:hypothetical protein